MGISLLIYILAAEPVSGLLSICLGKVTIGVAVKVLYDLELAAIWFTVKDLRIEYYPYITYLLYYSNYLDFN